MNSLKNIFTGKTPLNFDADNISGSEVVINNENFYKISNVSSMRPFFMSIVSPYNHWLFISSNGALSAGRKDKDNALFPYYTCLLYTSPSPRDRTRSRMPSSA